MNFREIAASDGVALIAVAQGASGDRRRSCGWILLVSALVILGLANPSAAARVRAPENVKQWIGTWATAPQQPPPQGVQIFQNQSLRLIVHISAGGTKVRIKISNTFGDQPLVIGAAHVARRATAAEIDPSSDRALKFHGAPSITVGPNSMAVSDPVELNVPALSDLAITLYLPNHTEAKTSHVLAKQTSYISPATGDSTAEVKFPVVKAIHTWPFLTGVDVAASSHGAAIVTFGSSLTDGDGTGLDSNGRWPDVLAQRLQKEAGGKGDVGVLNEGIIGNRLLNDSPKQPDNPFGASLGQAGLARFERDVLHQAGVKYVIVGIGINDISFPAFPFVPASEEVSDEEIISGYRQLIERAHKKGVRVIGTTNPPFENSFLDLSKSSHPVVYTFYSPEREATRQKVNDWIRKSGAFDAVIDFDAVLRDPSHPTQLLPAYDSGDHLHPNNAGCTAEGNAVSLAMFEGD